jgi:two-component system OmpR family response regulator
MTTTRTILLVEDNDNIRIITTIALEHGGRFDVLPAASGEEALRLAESHPVDLVLLDVMMPGMDGTETFAALRELDATRDTPIVFLTAKAQSTEVQRLLELGAKDVLTKPFDPLEIAERIAGTLDD